jgi:hypothetical protein
MQKLEKHKKVIEFNNSFVDSNLPTISISTVLSLLNEPFNQEEVAQKTCNKHFNNPNSQYFNKTVEEIIEMWQAKGAESRRYGSLNDEYIGIVLEGTEEDYEIFDLDNDVENDERLKKQIDAFDEFINDNKDIYEYVAREKTVYYKLNDFYVKGRFDALLYNKCTNRYVVVDWKTSGTVETVGNEWTKKMLGAAKAYDALNWYTYTMQVFFYKTALIESGYLPEGITYDDIDVLIVNFPGTKFENNKLYRKYAEAFPYDKEVMDKIFTFSYKKNTILNRTKTN